MKEDYGPGEIFATIAGLHRGGRADRSKLLQRLDTACSWLFDVYTAQKEGRCLEPEWKVGEQRNLRIIYEILGLQAIRRISTMSHEEFLGFLQTRQNRERKRFTRRLLSSGL